MPRLVTDQNLWRISAATVCVGRSEHPERVEWELQSGASLAAIDSEAPLYYLTLTQEKTDEGSRTGSFCHPCFLRSKIRRSKAPPSPGRRPIASERQKILEH